MGDLSRAMILNRRSNAIADMSQFDLATVGMTVEEALKAGIYKVNAQHQIGIATSTEMGLSMSRYPVRIVIKNGAANDQRYATEVDTVVSYWEVTNAANQKVPFQRKPLSSETAIANLYKLYNDFDKVLWDHFDSLRDNLLVNKKPFNRELDTAQNEARDNVYALLKLENPTEEQKIKLVNDINLLVATATAQSRVVAIKIDNDAYIRGIPHGVAYRNAGNIDRNAVMIYEVAMMLFVNRALIRERNPSLDSGSSSLCAYAICSMFRYGLYESYEHKEYVTVTVVPDSTKAGRFTIEKIDAPTGYEAHDMIKVGQALDVSASKIHDKMSIIGSLFVWISGLMHYLFNHTTGGTKVSGPMLTVCTMFNFLRRESSPEEQEAVTTALYEAVHPSNKRAIANIFFPTARVYTHGRTRGAYMYEKMELDAFAAIRKTPYPAGSHKAYVCTQALKKVIMSGLAPFLPWANQIDTVVNMCREVLSQGARSHIGSSYYTGAPPISQSASLDGFLPELAKFMQLFHQHDSLTASPHMGPDVAARALVQWGNLLRDIKSKDISGVTADVVTKFLSTTGVGSFGFNPEDEATWANAAQKSNNALGVLNNIFV